MTNTIEIRIFKDPAAPATYVLPGIPWYAGITALQAMVIGEAMYSSNFEFHVQYRSIFGAFVDAIDGLADDPGKRLFWLMDVNGQPSQYGASEAILLEDDTVTSATIEWKYSDVSKTSHPDANSKMKAVGSST